MVNVIIFGYGNIVKTRHLPTLLGMDNVNIVGVVSDGSILPDQNRKDIKIKSWHTSEFVKVADSLNIDAAVVATPPFMHYENIKFALQKSWHVLSEKPFVMKPDEGIELIDLAIKHNVTLSVVKNFIFSRSMIKLQKDLTQGTLGEIKNIFGYQSSNLLRRLPSWYENLPMGLFFDEAPHLFYLIEKVAGKVNISGSRGIFRKGRETPLTLDIDMMCGRIPAKVYMNFDSPISEWYLSIFCTDRVAVVDVFRDIYISIPSDNQHLPVDILRTSSIVTLRHWSGFFQTAVRTLRKKQFFGNDIMMRRWVSQVQTGNVDPDITAEHGLEIITKIHQVVNTVERKYI